MTTIEVRYDRESNPQVTHESPGLRFTESNFMVDSMDCGLAQILGTYPEKGFTKLDSDMVIFVASGYLVIEYECGPRYELKPHDRVCIHRNAPYRLKRDGSTIPLLFICNSPPFDPKKRKP